MSVYLQGSIAGVELENDGGDPCKVLLVDAGNFRQSVAASTQFAADGTPFTQLLPITSGRAFGVQIAYIPTEVLDDVIEAVNAAVEAGNAFNVSLADQLTTINHQCLPDFSTNWVKIPAQRIHPEMVKDVELRFIAIEEEES
jgi:hypothetical protein